MKKFLALMCAAVMLLSCLAGCGNSNKETTAAPTDKGTEAPGTEAPGTDAPTDAPETSVYPLDTDVKLTYWSSLSSTITAYTDNFGNTDFAKTLAERTGVEVEYIHPAAGTTNAIQLLLTEKNLPDMIEADWKALGAELSIEDGAIIRLNELIDQYAPNFKKYLEENPDIAKQIKTDDGTIYCFPFIRGDARLQISKGFLIRQDWLKELNLEMPETIADLEKVLIAFRDQKGAEFPFSARSCKANILGLFSTVNGFYLEDGKVVYGPLTDNYKTALETVRRWYAEGLIDPNYGAVTADVLNSNVLTGKTGVTVNTGGGGLGGWLDSMEGQEFGMVGMPYTALSENEPVSYFPVDLPYVGLGSVAISTSCKNPELVVQWLDYAYGEEGHLLYNFGVEGETYEVKDGEYVYTDLIKNNPNGLNMSQAMSNYFRSSMSGPFVQDKGYIDQFYYREGQQIALDNWTKNLETAYKNTLPAISLTTDEKEERTAIMTEVEKLEKALFTSIMKGTEPLEAYDTFVEKVKALNIERAIEITEAALARYNAR